MIGMKIYFDKTTGEVLATTGEGSVLETTLEQDILTFSKLAERNPNTFDVIQLEYKQHEQDFFGCNGYRVDVATKTLEFSNPDPSEPNAPQVFEKALSVQIKELETQQKQTNEDLASLMDFVINGGM